MAMLEKLKLIGSELKNHSPFTLLGAITGILFMLAGQRWFHEQAETLFSVFHPLHVVLSAMVTAALFEIHRKAKNFFIILIVGVVGSIGVATLSDCILPYFGETILGVAVPKHADLHTDVHPPKATETDHQDEHTNHFDHELVPTEPAHGHTDECGHPRWHIGFIEEWYLVFPAAILGVLLAYLKPTTHLPHASHVLLSTWASSAHMLMNTHADMTATLLLGMFIVLFLAVWLPCCVSDIVFPLLFTHSHDAHIPHSCILCHKKDKTNER
jgi:hypothetical protein